jgi:hypothetical protein
MPRIELNLYRAKHIPHWPSACAQPNVKIAALKELVLIHHSASQTDKAASAMQRNPILQSK